MGSGDNKFNLSLNIGNGYTNFRFARFSPWGCKFSINIGNCSLPLVFNPMPMYLMMDTCSWMDMPIMRDTRMDWILSPQVTLNSIASRSTNGNIFDNLWKLPGLTPGTPGTVVQETEEEKAARLEKEKKEKAEKEAKELRDREAQDKIDIYTELFEALQNGGLVRTSDPTFKNLKSRYDLALEKTDKEEKAKELEAIIKAFPPETLRQAALLTRKSEAMLYIAGYKTKTLKYSDKGIDVQKLRRDMDAKKTDELAGLIHAVSSARGAENDILQFLSTWNDFYPNSDERGFIRAVCKDIPKEVHLQSEWVNATVEVTEALVDKAETFRRQNGSDFPKLNNLMNDVTKALSPISERIGKSIGNIDKNALNKLADACDKLYAYLRKQEAILADREFYAAFKGLNELRQGTIKEGIIIKETDEDLKKEGITLTASDLDELPEVMTIEEDGDGDLDPDGDLDYLDSDKTAEGRVNYLTSDAGGKVLAKKTTDNGTYYVTTNKTGNTDYAPVRYFAVVGDKLVEITKEQVDNDEIPTDEEALPENAADFKIQDIVDYKAAAGYIEKLLADGAIRKVTGSTNVYISTGHEKVGDEEVECYYILKDNNLYKIKDCEYVVNMGDNDAIRTKGRTESITPDELTADDLEIVNDGNIGEVPSKTAEEERKEEEVAQQIISIETRSYNKYSDITNSERKIIAEKIAKDANKTLTETDLLDSFVKAPVKGFFIDKITEPKRYFEYKDSHLHYRSDIVDITETGHMTIKTSDDVQTVICPEYIEYKEDGTRDITGYAQEFAKGVRAITTISQDEITRVLNTFSTFDNTTEIVEFIEGYESKKGIFSRAFSDGLADHIVTEVNNHGVSKDTEDSATFFIATLADKLIKVVGDCNFDTGSTEYNTLKRIADGELISSENTYNMNSPYINTYSLSPLQNTARILDNIAKKVLKAYREKHPAETESQGS